MIPNNPQSRSSNSPHSHSTDNRSLTGRDGRLKPWLAALLLCVFCTPTFAQQTTPESRAATDPNRLSGFKGLDVNRDWPWWRGPSRNGYAATDAKPPVRFGKSENVLWKTPVAGRGHSSPVVVGQQIFLATADNATQVHSVLAFDLETGKQTWRCDLNQGGFPAQNHPKNTEASPTTASDGQHLFVTFFHHKQVSLFALDFSGEQLWEQNVGPFNPKKYEYGYAPSPLIYKQLVIVSAEHDGPSSLVAFERSSGREVWRTPRKPSISFSSPVIANLQSGEQLIMSGQEQVDAYDPATGRPLWSVQGTTSATCGTAVWWDNLVFASGGYPRKETIAVNADGSGRVAWRNSQKCYEQSMIVVDGFLYGLTDSGILYCWRAADGQEMWRERLAGPVSASPVYAGGLIYWGNEAGTVFVFKPTPEKYDLIAENRLGDQLFASPAVLGNRLLFRVAERENNTRQEYLYLIGER